MIYEYQTPLRLCLRKSFIQAIHLRPFKCVLSRYRKKRFFESVWKPLEILFLGVHICMGSGSSSLYITSSKHAPFGDNYTNNRFFQYILTIRCLTPRPLGSILLKIFKCHFSSILQYVWNLNLIEKNSTKTCVFF